MLRKNFFTSEEIENIVKDFRTAGLSDEEVAIMVFAQRVVKDAHKIQPDEIDALRNFGLEDEEIFDIILAASARSFFSKALDSAGIQPDDGYLKHIGDLTQVLAVGRPYKDAEE